MIKLVRKKLKIGIEVIVSSSENKMGNQFNTWWRVKIGFRRLSWGS